MVKDGQPKYKTRTHSGEFVVIISLTIAGIICLPTRVPAFFPLLRKSVVSLQGLVPVLAGLLCLITSRQEQVSLPPSQFDGPLSHFLVHGESGVLPVIGLQE